MSGSDAGLEVLVGADAAEVCVLGEAVVVRGAHIGGCKGLLVNVAAGYACLVETDEVAVLSVIAELAVSVGLEDARLAGAVSRVEHQDGVYAFLDGVEVTLGPEVEAVNGMAVARSALAGVDGNAHGQELVVRVVEVTERILVLQIRELSHQVEVAVIPRSIDCIDVGSLLVIAAECPRIIVGCAAGNHHVLSPVVVGGDGLVLADLSVRIGGIGALLN